MDNTKKLLRALQGGSHAYRKLRSARLSDGFFLVRSDMSTRIGKRAFSFTDPALCGRRERSAERAGYQGRDRQIRRIRFRLYQNQKDKKLAVPMERVSVPRRRFIKIQIQTDGQHARVRRGDERQDGRRNAKRRRRVRDRGKGAGQVVRRVERGRYRKRSRRAARILYARIRRGRPSFETIAAFGKNLFRAAPRRPTIPNLKRECPCFWISAAKWAVTVRTSRAPAFSERARTTISQKFTLTFTMPT